MSKHSNIIKRELWKKYYWNMPYTNCFCGCGNIIPADNIILSNINLNINNINYLLDTELKYCYIKRPFLRNSSDVKNIRPVCKNCYDEVENTHENLYDFCSRKNYRHKDELEEDEVVMMDITYKN
tara:strand:+ start:766 stop:1140 length:375 start_codon:yes stop_codon:yes gene_type:complete